MYISEIAETSIRGSLGTLFQLLLTIGILFIYVVGNLVAWKTLSLLCLVIPIILLIGLFFLPETPVYLLKRVSKLMNPFVMYVGERNLNMLCKITDTLTIPFYYDNMFFHIYKYYDCM